MKQPYVSTLIEQDFSDEEKSLARENIDAVSTSALLDEAQTRSQSDLSLLGSINAVQNNLNQEAQTRYSEDQRIIAMIASGQIDGDFERTETAPTYDYSKYKFDTDVVLGYADPSTSATYYQQRIEDTRATYLSFKGGKKSYQDFLTAYYFNPAEDGTFEQGSIGIELNGNKALLYDSETSGSYRYYPSMALMEQYVSSATSDFITSADVPPQTVYSAGPNIDIFNDIISTEKPRVEAGTNVSVTSSIDNVNRTITYKVSATDTTYSAGSGISIDANNVISADIPAQINTDWEANAGVAELLNKPNLAYKYWSDTATKQLKGIQYGQNSNGDWHHQIIINNGAMQSVGWGVPTRPSASANLVLTTDSNGKMQWIERRNYMYASNLTSHTITQTDVDNKYCDLPINWNVPSTTHVLNFMFCMGLSDMYLNRGNSSHALNSRVKKIKCSIFQDGVNTWYSNDNAHGTDPNGMIFNDILGSELVRVGGYWSLETEVKRAGMSGPYMSALSGPSFRVVFNSDADIQVGDEIVMTGRISGIDFQNGGW